MVRVDGMEGRGCKFRVDAKDLEKERKLIGLDQTISIGVDCAEEDWEGSGQRFLELLRMQLFLDRIDKDGLRQFRSVRDNTLQVVIPDLRTTQPDIRTLYKSFYIHITYKSYA